MKTNERTEDSQATQERGSGLAAATLLAAFRYRPQIRICMKDGTCKKMTPELLATMPNNHQEKYKMAFAFQAPRPELYDCGPRYCGKKPGVCSGQHCREIHCS